MLPLFAAWDEVATGNQQASRIVDARASMATARTKSPVRAVKAVTAEIDTLFHELAGDLIRRRGSQRAR